MLFYNNHITQNIQYNFIRFIQCEIASLSLSLELYRTQNCRIRTEHEHSTSNPNRTRIEPVSNPLLKELSNLNRDSLESVVSWGKTTLVLPFQM